MDIFDKFFNKNDQSKTSLSKKINTNINNLKEIFKDCDDVMFRDFLVGEQQNFHVSVVFIDGLINKEALSNFVLRPLLEKAREVKPNPISVRDNFYTLVTKGNISISDFKETNTLEDVVDNILSGETILLMDKYDKAVILSTRGWPMRSIDEPETETVIRGPREGFSETLKVNTTLIRRRTRDPKLKIKSFKIGQRSKTDTAIVYVEDIVNEKILEQVLKKLSDIKIDVVVDSSSVEHLIESNFYSPFPQVSNTERPDEVVSSLYEGRIAIIVDNTPFVLLAPTTLGILMQSSEDYYTRWIISTITRILRYIAVIVTLIAPALYIAFTSFHPGLIPTNLALYVAATRINVPFPAFVEAFLMEITIEFLREAGTRMSGPIGTTIGIVGGLIIGQAAVDAGIVSPLMIIIVAITTIASFTLPSYELASALRFWRFIIMVFASVLGLYGIMLAIIILLIHVVNLYSFEIPFTSPFSGLGMSKGDFKDTLVKAPIQKLKRRPSFMKLKKNKRQK